MMSMSRISTAVKTTIGSCDMVRDLLKRVRKCRYMVDACIKDLEQARRDAYTLKAVRTGDKVQNNHQSDLAQVVEKIERYEERLQNNIDELIGLKLDATAIIRQEPDLCARAILYRRYILAESWDTISKETGYSVRQSTRAAAMAINHLEFIER